MSRSRTLPAELIQAPFSVAAAASVGVSARRIRGSDLHAPFSGVRIHSQAVLTLRELCAAYRVRSPEGHVFSHVTAARLWRIPLPRAVEEGDVLDVAVVTPAALPRAHGVRGHRMSDEGLEVTIRYGVPVCDALTTWFQIGRILSHDDLVAAGDFLVRRPRRPEADDHRPFVDLSELRERAAHRRCHGSRAARAAAIDVREGADSRPESILRLVLQRAGLPEPELNPQIVHPRGHPLGWADLLYRDRRVIVEYDGDQHRTDYEQFEKDAVRLENFRRAGYTVVQVRKKGLWQNRTRTIARVREALNG